jgi:hypothetical protein
MQTAQANLELIIRCEREMETKISNQRGKIARIRSQGFAVYTEEQELAALLRALEVLKTILARMTDPVKAGNISN